MENKTNIFSVGDSVLVRYGVHAGKIGVVAVIDYQAKRYYIRRKDVLEKFWVGESDLEKY